MIGDHKVPRIDIKNYPALKNHLDLYIEKLEDRQDKGDTPYNLRNCAYHELMTREKVVWGDISKYGSFAYDKSGMFIEATAFMLIGTVKHLCAFLNSPLIYFYMIKVAPTLGKGGRRWKKAYVESLPLPSNTEIILEINLLLNNLYQSMEENGIVNKNNEVLFEIENMIYRTYGITKEERRIIDSVIAVNHPL